MTQEYLIDVADDGSLSFVYSDELCELLDAGVPTVRRVSHVEPNAAGQWEADMSPVEPGVVLGPYRLRAEALDAERNFLAERMGI